MHWRYPGWGSVSPARELDAHIRGAAVRVSSTQTGQPTDLSDSIEYSELMAGASAHGGDVKLAERLRADLLDSGPDEVATTAGENGERVAITSGGTPMTVGQVQAELQVLLVGE